MKRLLLGSVIALPLLAVAVWLLLSPLYTRSLLLTAHPLRALLWP